jgi:type IV pilus assembly protein PilP
MYKHPKILCGLVWILGALFFISGCEQKSEPPKAQVVRKKIVATPPLVRQARKSNVEKTSGSKASFRPKSAVTKTPKAMLATKSKKAPTSAAPKGSQTTATPQGVPGKTVAIKPKSVISTTPRALRDRKTAPQIAKTPPPPAGKKPEPTTTALTPTTAAAKTKMKAPKDKSVAPDAKTTAVLKTSAIQKPYNPAGKIDPFEPLFKEKPQLTQVKRKIKKRTPRTPLEKIDLSQLRLVGIVMAASGNKALVEEASGKGYIIKRGTYIGLNSGKVVDIQKDTIVIKEEIEDVLGKVIVRNKEIRLPKPTGE